MENINENSKIEEIKVGEIMIRDNVFEIDLFLDIELSEDEADEIRKGLSIIRDVIVENVESEIEKAQ